MSNAPEVLIREMLTINERQKLYYEDSTGVYESKQNSTATNLWRRFRSRIMDTIESVDVSQSLNGRYLEWVGDISDARLLDLGVGNGNSLSVEFARQSREYVAIDLSEARVRTYRSKLEYEGVDNATVLATDFLSDDFSEIDFDVVYAMSVMHHFQHLEAFLKVLHRRTSPNAIVLTLDPLETWLPARMIRLAYRPFQTDKAWEFPFSHHSLRTIGRYFSFEGIQGLYHRSKWATLLAPFSRSLALKKVRHWHELDWKKDRSLDRIGGSLRVAMALKRRDVIGYE